MARNIERYVGDALAKLAISKKVDTYRACICAHARIHARMRVRTGPHFKLSSRHGS